MANEIRLIDRKDCPMRHPDNGNCTVAGGFCTAVNDPICEALHNAYDCGRRSIDPESLRAKGRWDWKHRHKGGFHKYTGVDEYGETHTITVDERFECDEPYCPECGKWNESIYLNYCPNCGADMRGGK